MAINAGQHESVSHLLASKIQNRPLFPPKLPCIILQIKFFKPVLCGLLFSPMSYLTVMDMRQKEIFIKSVLKKKTLHHNFCMHTLAHSSFHLLYPASTTVLTVNSQCKIYLTCSADSNLEEKIIFPGRQLVSKTE